MDSSEIPLDLSFSALSLGHCSLIQVGIYIIKGSMFGNSGDGGGGSGGVGVYVCCVLVFLCVFGVGVTPGLFCSFIKRKNLLTLIALVTEELQRL